MARLPEWVHVWFWLRFLRDPQMMTALPQQEPDPDAMTLATYAEFQNEWLTAGAPTTNVKKVVAAMSGTIQDEDDDIPF